MPHGRKHELVLRMFCGSHERWSFLRYDVRTNDPDEPLLNLCVLHRCVTHGNRDGSRVPDGTNSSGGGDDRHSSDANTNHVPNRSVRTTSPGNNPNTKVNAMLPKWFPRTNHI